MKRIFLLFSREGDATIQPSGDDAVFNEASTLMSDNSSVQLFNILEQNPAMLEDKSMKEFYDVFKASTDIVNKKSAVPPVADTKTVAATVAAPAATATTTPVKKNVFLGGVGKIVDDFTGATTDNLVDIIKSKFGIDGADAAEILPKFLAAAATQRNQASEAGQVKSELESFKSLLNNLPAPLAQAVKAAGQGGDWEKALNVTIAVDYSKPFKDLSPEKRSAAIEAMTGNKIQDVDLDKPENKGIITAAERAFNLERENIRIQTEAQQRERQVEEQNVNSVVSSSIENLKKEYPNIDSDTISEIENVITKKGINSLFLESFVDSNGARKVRPVANIALRVALVLHGEAILKDMVAEAAAIAKADTKAAVIQASAADTKKDNDSNNKGALDLQAVAKQMKSQYIKTPTY